MNLVENTSGLHHPRPTVARAGSSSNPSGSSVVRPGIQYPATPVQRPHAPAPISTPDVRAIPHNTINTNGHAHPQSDMTPWKNQRVPTPERFNSTSPTVTRRSGRSGSDATSGPTYVDEHVITYPELNRSMAQVPIQPAVLRQRSASSPPEHLKANGAYGEFAPPKRKDSAPAVKPKVTRNNTGIVHFTPGK